MDEAMICRTSLIMAVPIRFCLKLIKSWIGRPPIKLLQGMVMYPVWMVILKHGARDLFVYPSLVVSCHYIRYQWQLSCTAILALAIISGCSVNLRAGQPQPERVSQPQSIVFWRLPNARRQKKKNCQTSSNADKRWERGAGPGLHLQKQLPTGGGFTLVVLLHGASLVKNV